MSAENFYVNDVIPLSFIRVRAGVVVSGLSPTVTVKKVATGEVILATTSLPEVSPSSGIYAIQWTHNQTGTVACVAIYTVAGVNYVQYFTINNTELMSRAQ